MDTLIGRKVDVYSVNGIRYGGVVLRIQDKGDFGELFELGSATDPSYRRLVYVVDRATQVHHRFEEL
jgi:hypothetical protein